MSMFFKSGAGYQPSGREIWHMQQRRQEQQWKRQDREADAADKIYFDLPGQIQAVHDQGAKAVAAAVAEIEKPAAAEVKRLLGSGVTQYTGASPENIIRVWHWKAADDPLNLGVNRGRSDAGVIIALPRGGGLERDHHVWRIVIKDDPSRLDDAAVAQWADGQRNLISETMDRYPILSKLRDNTYMARLFSAAGLTRATTKTKEVGTPYGVISMPITTVSVPTLIGVEVEPEGLVLRFDYREGDSAKKWGSQIDILRTAFKNAGVNASHLRVVDGEKGTLVLHFDDAPSAFPRAIAPSALEPPQTVAEAKRRYPELTWSLGVDARGNVIAPSVKNVYHALVVGETGAGKSVYLSGLIEAWRPFARVFLADPKGSDYTALENAPGIVMRSEDPAQHVVLVGEVLRELQRRQRSAGTAKRDGNANAAFDFIPVLLVLDEFTALIQDIRRKFGEKGVIAFLDAVDALMRKGRAFAIHIVIGSQDLYKDSIPVEIQGNAQLLVALGTTTDRTLMSKFIPDALSEDAKRIGQRINSKQKGRALYVDTENGKVREVQTYYAWSPGTTTLEPDRKTSPPTAEVTAAWMAAARVCEEMPRLYPRLGIQVDGSEWADADVPELLNVPTIALDGADGTPIPDRVQYDHRNALDWIGAEPLSDIHTAPETLEDMAAATAPVVDAPSAETPAAGDISHLIPTAEEAKAMSPEQRLEMMKLIAKMQGHKVDDEPAATEAVDETPSAAPEPKKRAPRKAAPKKPTEPRAGGDF